MCICAKSAVHSLQGLLRSQAEILAYHLSLHKIMKSTLFSRVHCSAANAHIRNKLIKFQLARQEKVNKTRLMLRDHIALDN
jgi:hypothetical protein